MTADAWRRYLPGGSWRYTVDEAGLKANLTDLQSAIGSAQLRHLPEWQQRRERIADRYFAGLAGLGLGLPARLQTACTRGTSTSCGWGQR